MVKPMCATDEYAMSFFISTCRNATSDAQTIATTLKRKTERLKIVRRVRNIGSENPQEAVAAHFQENGREHDRCRRRRFDVRVRNDVCTGDIGIFTANEAKNASQSHI